MMENEKTEEYMKVEEVEEAKKRRGENGGVDEDAEGREEDEMGQEKLTLLVPVMTHLSMAVPLG
jgi:hypothetical protein